MRRLDCVGSSGITLRPVPFTVGYSYKDKDSDYYIPEFYLCDFWEFDYSTFDYVDGENKTFNYRGYIFKGNTQGYDEYNYRYKIATVREDGVAFLNFDMDVICWESNRDTLCYFDMDEYLETYLVEDIYEDGLPEF